MIHQYSFKNDIPSVYLIPTPIGNLAEMNNRALDLLSNKISQVFCEDTRVTRKLLTYFQITQKLVSLNKINEHQKYQEVIKSLQLGKSVAIMSDAGYPLISDPGYYIVKKIIDETRFPVIPVSGPNAALAALIASGFNPNKFCFYGFFPRKQQEIRKELKKINDINMPIIFYESPQRILKTLQIISEEIGIKTKCCVAKELTKIHEQFFRGDVAEIIKKINDTEHVTLGEYVIIIDIDQKIKEISENEIIFSELCQKIDEIISKKKFTTRQAITEVAFSHNISKKLLYQKYHKKK